MPRHRARPGPGAARAVERASEPEVLRISRRGWVPNNERLPVLIYRGVGHAGRADTAGEFERLLKRNGWPPQWRNGIYSFHHYHSTAHEVLGCAAGSAHVMLGGPDGPEIAISWGDVLVLPAGTGHRLLHGSWDFLVVAAYPPEQHWDICRHAPDPQMAARMAALPFPASDPVSGKHGPLPRLWGKAPLMQKLSG